MRPAVPLSWQLLLTFVGLLLGMTAVLTTSANRSLLANLESEARRTVGVATQAREQTITQLFQLRQQRAAGFLTSVETLCGEPLSSRRLAWVDDCVRTMVDDFRRSERAAGAVLTYGKRRLRQSGLPVPAGPVPSGSLARVVRQPDGTVVYLMSSTRGQTSLSLRFDDQPVNNLFDDQGGLGRSGEVFLIDRSGEFLTPTRHEGGAPSPERSAEFVRQCAAASDPSLETDYRGMKTVASFRPVPVLGRACVVARVDYEETVAPAQRLRTDLIARSAWFLVVVVMVSLVAAQWISAPVRRLAASARTLQTGRFDRPLPLAGPSEVRALGHAFNVMANHLAELVAKEQAARREAEAANQAKDDFLARVSHELRTPLTAVLGWAQMLQSQKLPAAQVQHALQVIERSARAQRQLIEDLLDVSRIVSNRLRIAREPVRLADVVDQALDAVRPEASARNVSIEADLSDPALVLGDPRRLEQVVWNLAWNAVKFTQPSGTITVQLKRDDEKHLMLSVADTGVGIPSAFLPYVFEWFRQADPAARSQAGLGLGLGIVRHLVQLHGGSVRAESRGEGRGATFTVRLPIHEPATALLAAPAEAALRAAPIKDRLSAVRVLVVEDDDDTRELVRTTLELAGAQVEAVASAREARREMGEEKPDVLVSDIRMPEENGYSLIQSLRAAGVTTPAIALTAYARREDAEEAKTAGFQIHLSKPIDATRLVDAVATLYEQGTVH